MEQETVKMKQEVTNSNAHADLTHRNLTQEIYTHEQEHKDIRTKDK